MARMASEPFGRAHVASLTSVRHSWKGLGQCAGFLERFNTKIQEHHM